MSNGKWKSKSKILKAKWKADAKSKKIKTNSPDPHVCIRIFDDDTVLITDEKGDPLTNVTPDAPLPGEVNTYDQAIWSNNQICVWFRGRQH